MDTQPKLDNFITLLNDKLKEVIEDYEIISETIQQVVLSFLKEQRERDSSRNEESFQVFWRQLTQVNRTFELIYDDKAYSQELRRVFGFVEDTQEKRAILKRIIETSPVFKLQVFHKMYEENDREIRRDFALEETWGLLTEMKVNWDLIAPLTDIVNAWISFRGYCSFGDNLLDDAKKTFIRLFKTSTN